MSKKNDLAPTEGSINDANRKIPLRDFGRDRIQGARDIGRRKMNRRKFRFGSSFNQGGEGDEFINRLDFRLEWDNIIGQ